MSPRLDTSPNPLWGRNIGDDLKSVPETLSSWDNCMAKSYCKWPVIVAIIVGAVIVISILACIINCMCCGIQCCRCCGCCSCCCPKPRNKGPKYQDDPYNHPPPPPMPPPSNPVYQPSPAPPSYRGQQQVARFDSPKSPTPKVNEDALPAMPSWDNAVTRRVEDQDAHADAMEMEPLNAANHGPRRMPSNHHNNPDYMGLPPPIRTGTSSSYYPESRGYDDQSTYPLRSPGGGIPSPSPASPYDPQPYRDLTNAHPWQGGSPAPTSYTPQPPYMAVGTAITRGESPRPIPYRQPSPGFNQMPIGTAVTRSETPLAVPYRQPSPGFTPVPAGMPVNGPVPYRQPSPGFHHGPVDRMMSPSIPASPPPPFTAVPAPYETTGDPGRPPSLLQSGRKPAPNTYRDL